MSVEVWGEMWAVKSYRPTITQLFVPGGGWRRNMAEVLNWAGMHITLQGAFGFLAIVVVVCLMAVAVASQEW